MRSSTRKSRKTSGGSSNTKVSCSLGRLQVRVPEDLVEQGCEEALKEWVWLHCQDELKQALSVRKKNAPALVDQVDDDDDLSVAASVNSKASLHSRGGSSHHVRF